MLKFLWAQQPIARLVTTRLDRCAESFQLAQDKVLCSQSTVALETFQTFCSFCGFFHIFVLVTDCFTGTVRRWTLCDKIASTSLNLVLGFGRVFLKGRNFSGHGISKTTDCHQSGDGLAAGVGQRLKSDAKTDSAGFYCPESESDRSRDRGRIRRSSKSFPDQTDSLAPTHVSFAMVPQTQVQQPIQICDCNSVKEVFHHCIVNRICFLACRILCD